jgi:hypothetical protein
MDTQAQKCQNSAACITDGGLESCWRIKSKAFRVVRYGGGTYLLGAAIYNFYNFYIPLTTAAIWAALNFFCPVFLYGFTATGLIFPVFCFSELGTCRAGVNIMMQERKPARAGSEHSPFRNLTQLEWNPIFTTRRKDVQYATENERLIESRDLEVLEDGVVRCFMKSKDESDACLPRADKVEEYCVGATLGALQAEKGEVGGPNAWLDERSSAGGKEQARRYRGLLTPRSLYQELRRPVRCTEIRSPTIPLLKFSLASRRSKLTFNSTSASIL